MSQETFGERFARLRKARSLTQEDVAVRVNVTAQAVSKWENDISSPDISILAKLAGILGVSTDELLGNETADVQIVDPAHKPDMNKLILRINIDSDEGDMLRLNLPVKLIQIALAADNRNLIEFGGSDSLKSIDFNAILDMVESGVLGKILEMHSADGDNITIVVEEIE